MKKILITLLFLTAAFQLACKTSAADGVTTPADTSGSTTSTTTSTSTPAASTGTVSGTLSANATITLNQADGTTQSTNTTTSSPDYTFNNVPTGEATVTYNSGGQTTTQTVQVNGGQTTQISPFGSTQELLNSLKGQVYEITNRGSSTTVADILTNNPLGNAFYTRTVNVPARNFQDGFPGVTDRFEYFGVVYEGVITAPVTGEYTFETISDDGSVLYLNGNAVVNNDKQHAPKTKTGKITLTAGQKYNLLLKYFQGPRYQIALVVNVTIPGQAKKLFDMSDFK